MYTIDGCLDIQKNSTPWNRPNIFYPLPPNYRITFPRSISNYCVLNTATLYSGNEKEKTPFSAVIVEVSVFNTSTPIVLFENGEGAVKTTSWAAVAELPNEMEIGTSEVVL